MVKNGQNNKGGITVSNRLPALTAHAIAALQRGQKVEAVKIMRESFSLSLKDAKDAVDQYDFSYTVLPQNSNKQNSNHEADIPDYNIPDEVIADLQQGNRLVAIKRLCDLKGLNLSSAKYAIDTYLQLNPHTSPTPQGIQVKAASQLKWVLLLLLVFTVVAVLVLARTLGWLQ